MSLLEGHASYVMNRVAADVVEDLPRLQRGARAAARGRGHGRSGCSARSASTRRWRSTTRASGSSRQVVERIGMSGFNLVWAAPANLPQPGEIGDPDRWIARVAG